MRSTRRRNQPLVYRHFAYFSQETGGWIRETSGPVPAPDVPAQLVGEAREMALNAWATRVSAPHPWEIGLDVTHLGYPVGDFVWAEFDVINRRLHWPAMHRFLVVDRATGLIAGHAESGRPVRSNARHIVVDVTGTELEASFWDLWGPRVPRVLPESTSDDLAVVAEPVRDNVYAEMRA